MLKLVDYLIMNKIGSNRFSILHKEQFQIFISSFLFPTYLEETQVNMTEFFSLRS